MTEPQQAQQAQQGQQGQQGQQIPLEYAPIDNFETAIKILYAFLDRANKRGAFGLQESAKVMQCLSVLGGIAKMIDENNEEENVKPPTTPGNTAQQGVRKRS